MTSRSTMGLAALAVLILGAALLRLGPAIERGLWLDEIFTHRDAGKPIWTLLAWEHHRYHPPLSYLLTKVVLALTGSEREWALRLPSMLASVACIPAGWWVGRRLLSPLAGLGLAALLAVDPVMVYQGQQARMYSLHILLMLVTVGLLAGLSEDRYRSWWRWAALTAVTIALAWTSLAAAIAVPSVGVALLIAARQADPAERRRVLRGSVAAGALLLLSLLPALVHYVRRKPVRFDDAPSAAWALGELQQALGGIFGHPLLTYPLLLAGLLGLILLFRRRNEPAVAALLAIAILNAGLVLVMRATHSAIVPRYFVSLQVAVWIGLLTLAWWAGRRLHPLAGVAPVAGLVVVLLMRIPSMPISSYHGLSEDLRRLAEVRQPDEAVLFVPYWLHEAAPYNGVAVRPEDVALSRQLVGEAWDPRELPQGTAWLVAYPKPGGKGIAGDFERAAERLRDRFRTAPSESQVPALIAASQPIVVRLEQAEAIAVSP